MCIMMVMYRMVSGYPIVVAANRDEYYSRTAIGPDVLQHDPTSWGGRDQQAGGSWMGVSAHGLMVGLTNRRMHEEQENDESRRSRGLLCLDALRQREPADVAAWLASESPDRYNAFNLMVVNTESALWIAYDGKPEVHALKPGLHILANRNLNDTQSVRIRRAREVIEPVQHLPLDALIPHLQRVCRDHQKDVSDRDTMCMHREETKYGTVSSSILAVAADLGQSRYLYADAHPCESDYQDYSALFVS